MSEAHSYHSASPTLLAQYAEAVTTLQLQYLVAGSRTCAVVLVGPSLRGCEFSLGCL